MKKLLIALLIVFPAIAFSQTDKDIKIDTINDYMCSLIFETKNIKADNYRCCKSIIESFRGIINDGNVIDNKPDNSLKRKIYTGDDNRIYATLKMNYKDKRIRIVLNDFNIYDDGNNEWIQLNSKPYIIESKMRTDDILKDMVPGIELHNSLLGMNRKYEYIMASRVLTDIKENILKCLLNKSNDNW